MYLTIRYELIFIDVYIENSEEVKQCGVTFLGCILCYKSNS